MTMENLKNSIEKNVGSAMEGNDLIPHSTSKDSILHQSIKEQRLEQDLSDLLEHGQYASLKAKSLLNQWEENIMTKLYQENIDRAESEKIHANEIDTYVHIELVKRKREFFNQILNEIETEGGKAEFQKIIDNID
ncbi:MAG: hypothetical protein QG566_201 [Patescibacteria group bacterium]|nr:hypothetical protein [Patescibacteria group bacterium]